LLVPESFKSPACNIRMGVMPGDPEECRQQARNCKLLAEQTANQDSKQTLLHLAQSWAKLAAELESALALLNAVNEIKLLETESE
jgi:hypothetical protein